MTLKCTVFLIKFRDLKRSHRRVTLLTQFVSGTRKPKTNRKNEEETFSPTLRWGGWVRRNPEWEVAHIVKQRDRKDKSCEFLISWKGYTSEDGTWEAEEHLNCPDVSQESLARIEEGKRKNQRAVTKKPDRRSKRLTVGKKKIDNRSSKRFDRKPR